MTLLPYVVQQGDHLPALAARLQCKVDDVWKDASNAPLDDAGRTPHILAPGDILYLPPPKRTFLPVKTGAANAFSATVPTMDLEVRFLHDGLPVKSEPVVVQLTPPVKTQTGDDGVLKLPIPATAQTVVVEFPGLQISHTLLIGHLNPITLSSGVRQRLENLGHYVADNSDEALSIAVLEFQNTQPKLTPNGLVDKATRDALEKAHGS